MIQGFVEVSHESVALAEAEAVSASEALGGGAAPEPTPAEGLVAVDLPSLEKFGQLAARLALARRCLVAVESPEGPLAAARREGQHGGSAAFRRIGRPSGSRVDQRVLDSGREFKRGGGTIDLDRPSRRFWLVATPDGRDLLLEEVGTVDRAAPARRRMPLLPFRRPVSLPPKLARAAVNLARVRAEERVLDPFLGTGALLAEAGLLGARLYGIDRDPAMVRGALRNFVHLGVAAEELVVGDARTVSFTEAALPLSAIVTDAPYGRSSSTGGASAAALVGEVVRRWSDRLDVDGRVVVVAPSGPTLGEVRAVPRYRIPVRVHRSLTREFCVFERDGLTRSS